MAYPKLCGLSPRLGHQLRSDLRLTRHRRTNCVVILSICHPLVVPSRPNSTTQGHRGSVLLSNRPCKGSFAIYLKSDPLFIPIFCTIVGLRGVGTNKSRSSNVAIFRNVMPERLKTRFQEQRHTHRGEMQRNQYPMPVVLVV